MFTNIVEVDEVYLGDKEKNKHEHKELKADRGSIGKQAVVGVRQRQTGKTKMFVVANTRKPTTHKIILNNVAPKTIICSDEHESWTGLDLLNYIHKSVNHSTKEFVNGTAHTNGIESVWALLKRGYNGVFHHISSKHLFLYINEFAFRLDKGDVKVHTLDRIDGLIDGALDNRLTYKELISNEAFKYISPFIYA